MEELSKLSDAELVQLAKVGQLEAFEVLVDRYERRVYTLAYRILNNQHDAEDATQETFLRVLEHLKEFQQNASFSTWLFRIATNTALKILHKRKEKVFLSLQEQTEPDKDTGTIPHPEYIADWQNLPDELIQQTETWRIMEEALQQLDKAHRLVFLLRDVEGLSIKETAQILGISENNVKIRLLRARLKLREILTRAFGGEPLHFRKH